MHTSATRQHDQEQRNKLTGQAALLASVIEKVQVVERGRNTTGEKKHLLDDGGKQVLGNIAVRPDRAAIDDASTKALVRWEAMLLNELGSLAAEGRAGHTQEIERDCLQAGTDTEVTRAHKQQLLIARMKWMCTHHCLSDMFRAYAHFINDHYH